MSVYDKAFATAYEQLNEGQREAVDTIEGPVLVIAGPGTGKTQVLTLRIVNIIRQTDVAPEQILALTFTDAGARAMRDRLRQYIGVDAYAVSIHTFHSFADSLIRWYPDAYDRVVGGSPLSELEQIKILETILQSDNFTLLRPVGNPTFHITAIRQQLATLKQEYISPANLASLIEKQREELTTIPYQHESGPHKGKVTGAYQDLEKRINKQAELLRIYQQYQAILTAQRRYDFADMIVETVAALESNTEMLSDLQEKFQYILADEHQDVNGSQNRIIELLASFHQTPNIFVVGDEKQAIFRFQGASLSNFLFFENHFPGTKSISLTQNYRSGQEILDAAQALITVDNEEVMKLRVPLQAAAVKKAAAQMRVFTHDVTEMAWIIETVAELATAEVELSEIAIIVRTNREVEQFAAELRKRNIPAQASADGDIYSHTATQTVRALLAAVVRPEDEAALTRVVHGAYWGIGTDDLVRLLSARSYQLPLRALVRDKEVLVQAGIREVDSVLRVHDCLEYVRARMDAEAPQRVLEHLLHESGLLAYLHTVDPVESGRVVRRLYDEVEGMVASGEVQTLADVDKAFAMYDAYGLGFQAPYISVNSSAVQVMTAHRSKGLEFLHVFVPHVTDTKWGGAKRPDQFKIPLTKTTDGDDLLDDDRRLLYVACTRAKTHLYVSYAKTSIDGKDRLASRLLESVMQADLLPVATVEDFEDAISIVDTMTGVVPATNISSTVLTELLLSRGISPTAFNNYRNSPWDYIYRNLLRLPEVTSLSMQFGTVVHALLERFVIQRSNSDLPTATTLSQWLDTGLGRLALTKEEFVQLHEKGLSALTVCFEKIDAQLQDSVSSRVEVSLQAELVLADEDATVIPLNGKLDRIDYAADGSIVRVVDYKTGGSKSRNVIEGKTKTSNGNYKQQLIFYALLLAKSGAHHSGIAYTIVFVEPNKHGVIKEESFYITEEEMRLLEDELISMAKDIMSGKCLQTPCDPAVSEYCEWVQLLSQVGVNKSEVE